MKKSFSIIIPLFNKERTIAQTLDSLARIEGVEYEVVVVDDGSTDNSPDIVEAYPSNRIKLYRKDNGGVSSARNYGALRATYSWLIFLDADDLLFPCALHVFSDLIERHPVDEVFVGNYQQLQYGKLTSMYCHSEYVSENPHRDIFLSRFYLRPGVFCCSRHAFNLSGGYDERMSYNEDFEYCMRLTSIFRVVVSPIIVMEYVTEESEGRVKTHPLEKNFAFYLPYMNITDKYVRWKYYKAIKNAIAKYSTAHDQNSTRYLLKIKKQKFGVGYSFVAWFYETLLLNIHRYRRVKALLQNRTWFI